MNNQWICVQHLWDGAKMVSFNAGNLTQESARVGVDIYEMVMEKVVDEAFVVNILEFNGLVHEPNDEQTFLCGDVTLAEQLRGDR